MNKRSGLRCANCGKGVMYGHNVSHAKNRTRKIFKPNLHSTRVMVDGVFLRVRLCTKCQRILKNPKSKLKTEVKNIKAEEIQAPLVATA